MNAILGFAAVLGAIALAIAQLIAGYQGIEHHFGGWWAWGAVFVALAFRFTLPISIGAFFGATDVWGWHWLAALAFVAPGLVLVVPGILASLLSWLSSTWRSRA